MHARFFLISNFLAFCQNVCYTVNVKKRWRAPVGAFSAFFTSYLHLKFGKTAGQNRRKLPCRGNGRHL